MANEFIYPEETLNKIEKYQLALKQVEAIIMGEPNLVANLANVSSILKYTFNFFWVGFYIVEDEELVLGPFQGTSACTRIKYGKGVCGSAWKEKKAIIVDDVEQFPGHIACSSASKSEIVIPVFNNLNQIKAVLDVDSDAFADFDEVDLNHLTNLAKLLQPLFND